MTTGTKRVCAYSTNISIPGFGLFLLFLILKLTDTVDWSWWIITLPLWIGLAFILLFVGIMFVFGVLLVLAALFVEEASKRKK